MQLNPNYFGSYLGGGVAQTQLGNKQKAEECLTRSAQLLPTAPAAYYLGNIARERGDIAAARQYYQAAASSQSPIGQAAAVEFMKMDLPQNPGNYVARRWPVRFAGPAHGRGAESLAGCRSTPSRSRRC